MVQKPVEEVISLPKPESDVKYRMVVDVIRQAVAEGKIIMTDDLKAYLDYQDTITGLFSGSPNPRETT